MRHFIQSSLLHCYMLVYLFSFGAAFLTPYSHWDTASSTTCTSKRTPVSTLPAYYFSYPTPFRSHDQHALFQKKMKFVLYYQNYRDPQDFVVDDQQRSTKQEHLPTEAASSFTVVVVGDAAAAASPCSTLVSSSHSSSPSVAATTAAGHPGEKSAARSTVSSSFINKSSAAAGATNNALTISAAANVVPSIDLPRAVFEKLILLRERDEDSFPADLEILSGRIAIVLSLYFFSTEILTGEGVLDQVSHFFS
jgi:hypothetical protein